MHFISTSNKGLIKKENEDFLGQVKTNQGHLFVVCDGLSSFANSAMASRTAIKTILEIFTLSTDKPIEQIKNAIEAAHLAVISLDIDSSLGTTIALVYIEKNIIYSAWCGDSRIYYFHNQTIDWISRDHNVLHDILNKGKSSGKIY